MIIPTGEEGERTMRSGNFLFTLDCAVNQYPESALRLHQLGQAGYYTSRTQEVHGPDSPLNKRGHSEIIYFIWKATRSTLPKSRGRKPGVR